MGSTCVVVKDEYSLVISKSKQKFLFYTCVWTPSFWIGDFEIIMFKKDENESIL